MVWPWETSDYIPASGIFMMNTSYAVNDDNESDNKGVAMVTDASSNSQETSLVDHVSVKKR